MNYLDPLFLELGIIIFAAAVFGVVAKIFRQPPILGYILAGIILGPIGAALIENQESIKTFSSFGIALLLFLVGLEMNWSKLKRIGNITVALSIVQILITFLIGFTLAQAFDFPMAPSLVLGLALSFSSTIIVVKLLSEKHDLDSLYGRVTVGVLLAQDLVAIFAIAVLAGFAQDKSLLIYDAIILLSVKALCLIVIAWFFSFWIFPKIFKIFARSQELIFITSLAWCFLFSIFTVKLGLSLEIGAFLAGISLASLPYAIEIIHRIRSLRDFFIILFFIVLGTNLNFSSASSLGFIILFALLAIVIKPLIVLIGLGALGLRRRTAFMVGLGLGQMSEFSLILAGLALKLNLIDKNILSILTVSATCTLIVSPFFINNAEFLFRHLRPFLAIFEKRSGVKYSLETDQDRTLNDHIIIFGYHRMGYHILKTLNNLRREVLIIDFNPETIDRLKNLNIPAIFGDAQDEELLESIHLQKAKMIVSTIPHREETFFLIKKIRKIRRSVAIIVTAKTVEDALEFYQNGADYVILPEKISGEHMANLLVEYETKTLKKRLNHKSEEIRLLRTKKQDLYFD